MSTADRLRRRGSRGFSVLEMCVTTAILATTTLVIQRTVTGVNDTEMMMRAIRNTAERCEKASYRLRDMVASSRKLFHNDTVGNGYLAKLGLPASAPRLSTSRLPKFDEAATIGPDAVGDPHTGNVILFAREADALPCVAVTATKKMRAIDAYRFVCIYLSQSTRTLVAGGQPALDLVEWKSDVYPSYAQVVAISVSAEKTKVVQDLYTRWGVDYLWDSTKPVSTAFYAIDGAGTVAATPTNPSSIPEDRNVSARGRLVVANLAVARTDTTSVIRTPLFTVEPTATWSPHGFEVKIAAPSGARRVWMRLTLEQQAAKGRVPAHQTTVLATTRDT